MTDKWMRKLLLAGTAIAAMATGLPDQASAQTQMPGFFGGVAGWYIFDSGNDALNFKGLFKKGGGVSPDDGWGGRAFMGYRFSNNWDVAFGGQGSWLSRDKNHLSFGPPSGLDETVKAHYWALDAEIGYTAVDGNLGVRLFGGLRYAQWKHDYRLSCTNAGECGAPTTYDNRVWGIGPRIGVDGSYRFGMSNFSAFGHASASLLFGKSKGKMGVDFDGVSTLRDKQSNTMWNFEAALGVAYEFARNWNLGVGYRMDFWSNVADASADIVCCPSLAAGRNGQDRLMHGPFARVTYNYGAPTGAPAPVAAPPAAVMAKSFIVFFDFDRSDLTQTALGTIRQAADAAKAGQSARVNVTGHADKSGGDQYNMALSLRRANNVKDELVRQGVPAASIVVVGRGESQPLVPTADGVKEPQNRRVEIVLN